MCVHEVWRGLWLFVAEGVLMEGVVVEGLWLWPFVACGKLWEGVAVDGPLVGAVEE